MSVKMIGFDADGDKVYRDDKTGLVATGSGGEQGAEWTFECGGGMTLANYAMKFGPITKEKKS